MSIIARAGGAVLFSLGVLVGSSFAQAPKWVSTGGPIGGAVQRVGGEGDLVLAATFDTVFRSTDGGLTWGETDGLPSFRVSFAEVAAGRAFVGMQSSGLWVSDDDGKTWERSVTFPSDQPVMMTEAGGSIYVMAGTSDVLASADGGDTWTPVPPPDGDQVVTIMGDGEWLYAGAFFGVFRTNDAGQTWLKHESGLPVGFPFVQQMGKAGGSVLAYTTEGVYRSADGGRTWKGPATGFPKQPIIYEFAEVDGKAFAAVQVYPSLGVWKSEDGGASWADSSSGLPGGTEGLPSCLGAVGGRLFVGVISGAYRSADAGASWGLTGPGMSGLTARAMSAADGTLFLTTQNARRVFRTSDAGETWPSSDEGIPDGALCRGVFAPDGATVLMGTDREGVYRSNDGGVTWVRKSSGLPKYNGTAGLQYREMDVLAAGSADGAIYAGTGFGTEFIGGQFVTTGGGIFKTLNRGDSWTEVNKGLPITRHDSFGDPKYDPVAGMGAFDSVVFAGLSTRGVYRSLDDGANWFAAATGLPTCGGQMAWVQTFAELGDTVFAGVGFVGVCKTGPRMFRSGDLGAHWTASATGLPDGLGVLGLAVRGGELVAALDASGAPGVASVYRSADGGMTWAPYGDGMEGRPVELLSVVSDRLMAANRSRGVWRLEEGSECRADCNGDGVLNINDFICFQSAWKKREAYGDYDGSGTYTINDFIAFQAEWRKGC